MRTVLFFIFYLFSLQFLIAQEGKPVIYNEKANALQDLQIAIKTAENENKHVLIQVGGNWCSWCIKLHNFIESNCMLDSIIKIDYVFIRINYSKNNKNIEVMEKLGCPQRFGFPVFVVLNTKGERIHTQDTGFLEENNSYSMKKISTFLLNWNVQALCAYKNK